MNIYEDNGDVTPNTKFKYMKCTVVHIDRERKTIVIETDNVPETFCPGMEFQIGVSELDWD